MQNTELQKAIRYDTNWSVLLGPIRVILPTVGSLILYRVVLQTNGLETLGLWSLISAIANYLSLTDVGFSQLLTREFSKEADVSTQANASKDFQSAKAVYFCFFSMATPPIFICVYIFEQSLYNKLFLASSLIIVVWGVFFQMISKLNIAILSANQDFRHTQVFASLSPLLTSVFGIAGALHGHPIEALSIGYLFSGIALCAATSQRMSTILIRKHGFYLFSFYFEHPFYRGIQMIKRGFHLYTLSIGMLIREPTFRLIIAFSLGTSAVGVYTIAARASSAVRDVVANGFNVLYPSFTTLLRMNDTVGLHLLLKYSFITISSLGAISIGSFWVLADPLIEFWLDIIPAQSISSVRILLIWNLITLFNLPFFFLLKASGMEKIISASVWIHSALLFMVIPASYLFVFNVPDLLIYWTLSSIITQIIIYYQVHAKLSLLLPTILSPSALLNILLLFIFLLYCYYVETLHPMEFHYILLFLFLACILYLFFIVLFLFPLKNVYSYLSRLSIKLK